MPTGLTFKLWIDRTKDTSSVFKEFVECFDYPEITKIYTLDQNQRVIEELEVNYNEKKFLSLSEVSSFLFNLDKPWSTIRAWGRFIVPIEEDYISFEKNKIKVYSYFLLGGSTYHYFIKDDFDMKSYYLVSHEDLIKKLYTILKKIVDKWDPLIVWMGPSTMADLSWWFEYYRDPYFFCIEPPEDEIPEFLSDENIHKRLDELKEILPREELLKLIEENSDAIIRGKEGIGIIRKSYEKTDFSQYAHYICPRYFIRKELRRRGTKLKPGITEEMILEGLRIRPDALKNIGFVDEEFCRKTEEARRRVEECVREKLVSSGKYERDLLEKYEEMDRKCEEYKEKAGKRNEEYERYERECKRLVYSRSEYLDEFNREYTKELEKVILEMLPEDMLKDLGFE
jgi:hypothetical protein